MILKAIIALFFLSLSGCAARVVSLQLPSGKPGYLIKCWSRVEKCYGKATELCPDGYEIVDSKQTVSGGANGIHTRANLLIGCKERENE